MGTVTPESFCRGFRRMGFWLLLPVVADGPIPKDIPDDLKRLVKYAVLEPLADPLDAREQQALLVRALPLADYARFPEDPSGTATPGAWCSVTACVASQNYWVYIVTGLADHRPQSMVVIVRWF